MRRDRIAPRGPAPTLGTARRRLRREKDQFVVPGCAPPLVVANTPPSAAQRHQAIAVAESLAGVSQIFPWRLAAPRACLVRPLASSQSGETVSKERLRFDTRLIEPQRKIALGNFNRLTSALKLIDVCFSDCAQKPLWLRILWSCLDWQQAYSSNYVLE